MQKLNLTSALSPNVETEGVVYMPMAVEERNGKRGTYVVGQFADAGVNVDFKIWEHDTFKPVVTGGPGVYDVRVVGSAYQNQKYLTVKAIAPTTSAFDSSDFLLSLPANDLASHWTQVMSRLTDLGLSETARSLITLTLNRPELGGRFFKEGAAVFNHDNVIGGLWNHTTKMLRLLVAVMENNPELIASIDLLTYGIVVHDIGKVFEYDNLTPSETWYASHHVRGIELMAALKDEILTRYDEPFYRQIQSIIDEHHGEYGARPNTVAAAIVHLIDLAEARITALLQQHKQAGAVRRILSKEWGYLYPLTLSEP